MTQPEWSPRPEMRAARGLFCSKVLVILAIFGAQVLPALDYRIVDTGQTRCYEDRGGAVACPAKGAEFYGQDAQYSGNSPSYRDHGDGTISDLVTGLMWQKSPDTDGDGRVTSADKLTYEEAVVEARILTLAGHEDWRLPTIKELYSLILLDGEDPPPGADAHTGSTLIPFIDSKVFDFAYGDPAAGERIIDSQYASSTLYVSRMGNDGGRTLFGVNFADGRIKGYGLRRRGRDKRFFVLYVRGNPDYGKNDWVDNGDGTISDSASGLTWQRGDSGLGLEWSDALAYCEDLSVAGQSDWRLPDAKELQSLVDYSRSPDTTGSAAIDPLFRGSGITNERGEDDYPSYWSSTTHVRGSEGDTAVYLNFGRAMGYVGSRWTDVHGAGSQRSDPKSGDVAEWPRGRGPQGDAIRIQNHVRCVRGGEVVESPRGEKAIDRQGVEVEIEDYRQSAPSNARPRTGRSARSHRPPEEAIEACVDRDRGAACEFRSPHGQVRGRCESIERLLACLPAGGPPDRRRNPR